MEYDNLSTHHKQKFVGQDFALALSFVHQNQTPSRGHDQHPRQKDSRTGLHDLSSNGGVTRLMWIHAPLILFLIPGFDWHRSDASDNCSIRHDDDSYVESNEDRKCI